MCYWLITDTNKEVSNTLVEHVKKDDYLKPGIKSRIDDFNKKMTERLGDGNFHVNKYVYGKLNFILLDEDFRKN